MTETYQKMLWEPPRTYEKLVSTDTMPLTLNIKGLSLEAQEKQDPRIRRYTSGQKEGLHLLRNFLISLGMQWTPGGTGAPVKEACSDYFWDPASNACLTLTKYCVRDGVHILYDFINVSGIFIRSQDKSVCDRLADQIEAAMAEIRTKVRAEKEIEMPDANPN